MEFIDVPVDPIVQEHEVFHDSADVGSRKLGTKLMAEKAAGSGVFFRAFVMNSKVDRVLLHFPTDLQGGALFNMLSSSQSLFACHHSLTIVPYCRSRSYGMGLQDE